jgi:hypothetical protein
MNAPETAIQLRLSSLAHAFSDEGRKHAVRMLAKEVAAIEAERDQLRAQVETLKAERNAAGMRERNSMLAIVEKWKAYAERLEVAGEAIRPMGIGECECEAGSISVCLPCYEADVNWQQAKETKP